MNKQLFISDYELWKVKWNVVIYCDVLKRKKLEEVLILNKRYSVATVLDDLKRFKINFRKTKSEQ